MNTEAKEMTVLSAKPASLVVRTGERFGVEPQKLLATLKATCFRGDVSVEQMMALLVVADQYNLNPFTKEIYAFPDKRGGIVPIVGLDGWSRLINENPQYDGIEFVDGPATEAGPPEYIECRIFRKDRSHATTVREHYSECKRDTDPWKLMPRRMLRHKAMIQCARIAFAYVGVYDEDEGERIVETIAADRSDGSGRVDTKGVDPAITDKWVGDLTDVMAQDKPEFEIAADLREQDEHLQKFPDLYTTVMDALAARGIITKANYRKYLKIEAPAS